MISLFLYHLLHVQKNSCFISKVGPRGGGSLWVFGVFFQAHSPNIRSAGKSDFFAWSAHFFVSLGKKVFFPFPGLREATAAILQQLFGSELHGLLLLQDQGE